MNTLTTILTALCLFSPIFGAFILVGKYVINTDKIIGIDKDYQDVHGSEARRKKRDGKVAVEMENDGYFYVSKDEAKDLLEWTKEATAKCSHCNRFDCNCGARG